MKLILAIVNNEDSAMASSALTEEGFMVTRLSTSGGFLMVGNTTFLIGTDDDGIQRVIDILKIHCKTRTQTNPSTASYGAGLQNMSIQGQIRVGGATIFVLDVARMEKI